MNDKLPYLSNALRIIECTSAIKHHHVSRIMEPVTCVVCGMLIYSPNINPVTLFCIYSSSLGSTRHAGDV